MNENYKVIIKLSDLLPDDDNTSAFGNDEGREVLHKLSKQLDSYPGKTVIGISLEGIRRTDASFPRESIVSLAKSKKGEKGFFLMDFVSKDLRDNWDYAAKAKEQPMIVLVHDGYEVIGHKLYSGAKELLDFIMGEGVVTTSKVAEKFDVSAQNASGKLKKLYNQGLILASKEVAESGGMEFVYKAIK